MADRSEGEITEILRAIRRGDDGAEDRLFATVYHELHRMAAVQRSRERGEQTLQTTALVHEAFLRLRPGEDSFENRRHFFGAAGQAMRRILVDEARKRLAERRRGDYDRGEMPLDVPDVERPEELIALDGALDRLAKQFERPAQVVIYRHFVGFGVQETADVLGVSASSVDKDWKFARAWLRREVRSELGLEEGPGDGP